MSFSAIIPARFGSTRFPGKPLAVIDTKPMVQHVYERCREANADRVIVATDDRRIEKTVLDFGGEVCLTSEHHESGTTRLAEVIETLNIDDNQIIVNVQGDEPFIPAANIRQVAENLIQCSEAKVATLSEEITNFNDLKNPNIVKVVTNKVGLALYFSRAMIPFDRDLNLVGNQSIELMRNLFRHIGIYAYRAGFVREYVALPASDMENIEKLEQLRVLWHGYNIHVAKAIEPPPIGIDTPEDLKKLANS